MISILPLVVGLDEARKRHAWHDALFAPNPYTESPIKIAILKNNSMQFVFENNHHAWNADKMEEQPHIFNFAARTMLGQGGYEDIDMEDVSSYLVKSMTHEDTSWGRAHASKMLHSDFAIHINSFGYWLAPLFDIKQNPLAKHVASDLLDGLFRTSCPNALSERIKDAIAMRNATNNEVESCGESVFITTAFCPGLDEYSTAHDVLFHMKKLQEDMQSIENTKMGYMRLLASNIETIEVLTPIFVPKVC